MKIFTSYVILKLYLFLFNKYILWIRKLSKYLSHQCWYVQTNPPWKAIVDWGQFNCNIYIQFNFHFCATFLKTLYYDENRLSRSRVKVKVVWWCWGNVNELHICHMEVEETIQMLRNYCTEDFSKKVWIKILFFFETRSRFL